MDKPTLARKLLASQRSAILWAIATCERHSGDAYFDGLLLGLRDRLAEVAKAEADLERAPEFHAPLVLMSQTDRAPLIRVTCGYVEQEAVRLAAQNMEDAA